MNFYDNLDKLKNHTKHGNGIQHQNENSMIIPFVHRGTRAEYNNGFYNIIGHLSRYLLGYEWDANLLNEMIPDLLDKIDDKGRNNKKLFKSLLKDYLFDKNNQIIISHPHLYLFVPPSYIKKDESDNTNYTNKTFGERRLAQFFKDVFFKDYEEIYSFLSNKESDNFIFKFILENIELDEFDYSDNKPYYPILNNIIDIFQEDFSFAMNHPSFLFDHIDEIFAYYYFFYSNQLILNIHKDFEFYKDENQIEECFYLLEGEVAQDFRKAVHVGYNLTSDWVEELLCKIYVIDQLNMLLGTKDYMYGDILNFYEDLEKSDQKNFYDVVKEWVQYYRDKRKMNNIQLPIEYNSHNLKNIINILFKSMMSEKGVTKGSRESRYPLNLSELGKNFQLIKFRTIYSYTFNLTNDMLLLLTTLTVKDRTDMRINEFFSELRKRGIFFDKQSEDEVKNFLIKRNLIDKKSDSEEGSYVKPIL